jgi:FkbM family methyltransferase
MLPRVNLVRGESADYLLFATADLITRRLTEGGAWEPHLVQITRAFTDGIDQPLVLDIGANLGGYSIPVAKALAAAGGTVHAFEAQRIVHYQLCGNVFLNRLDNVFVRHLALGDRDGEIEVPVPDYAKFANVGGFSLSRELRELNRTQAAMTDTKEPVAMARLDSLRFPRAVNFVKLDVEGYELAVLQGAHEFLGEHRHPPVFFEAWSEPWFERQKKELLEHVASLGYSVIRLGAYDHLAQHPQHPVQIGIERSGNAFSLRRR